MTEIQRETTPRLPTPPGACDTHMHIYHPEYAPRPGTNFPALPATVGDYRKLRARLGLTRSVVVQPTAYGNDHRCTLMAMQALGHARGVAILLPSDSDTEIGRLHLLGMRGLRYHMLPGGGVTWETLPAMAARVAAFGWHVQVQMEGREFAAREAVLNALPCDLVIDHIGRFAPPLAVNDANWAALLRLIDSGRCWVKLSAAYHGSKSGPPRYEDVAPLARELIRAAPERMLWASNWPHPMVKRNFPDDAALLDLVSDWAGSNTAREQILVANPAKLYGF
ncbi:MAG: amidohydrolase family protein [Burkholderiales bacterium]|nr:amidohydrolase family protein [Burkholderiales bacterium]